MQKDVLEAWNNRVEYDFVSSPGMGDPGPCGHFCIGTITSYKDGEVDTVKKVEESSDFSLTSPYPSLRELLSSRFPVTPEDQKS